MLTTAECVVGFAGIVTAASLWNIFGGDIFPAEKDPTGGKYRPLPMLKSVLQADNACLDPNTWTETELRRWLKAVSILFDSVLVGLRRLDQLRGSGR
jgi:hypothetical protein